MSKGFSSDSYSDSSLKERRSDVASNIRDIEEELEFEGIYSKGNTNNCGLKPKKAWDNLHDAKINLIDMRLIEEVTYGGYADLSEIDKNKAAIPMPHSMYPLVKQATDFQERYNEAFPNPDTPNIFICSTGSKSKQLVENMIDTHPNCRYIEGGFRGPLNPVTNKRGEIEGWKAAGLPWADH